MTRAQARWSAVGGVWLLIGAACSQQDSTQLDPIASAGTAGAGMAGAGGSNVNGGSAGAGGSQPEPTDAGAAVFRAVRDGELVELVALDAAWYRLCEQNNPQLMKSVNGAWVPLQDDRPYSFNLNRAAHYLDGTNFSDCQQSLGCDTGGCSPMPGGDRHVQLRAREYVQVGEARAGVCGSDAGAEVESDAGSDAGVRHVPNIESRTPTEALAVRVTYYREKSCGTEALTVDVPVE